MVNIYSREALDAALQQAGSSSHDLSTSSLEVAVHCLDCTSDVWAVAFRPEYLPTSKSPTMLATGSKDRSVRLWSVSTANGESTEGPSLVFQLVAVLNGHTDTVSNVAWHPDGSMLVSTSFDKTVRLSATFNDQTIQRDTFIISHDMHDVCFSLFRCDSGGQEEMASGPWAFGPRMTSLPWAYGVVLMFMPNSALFVKFLHHQPQVCLLLSVGRIKTLRTQRGMAHSLPLLQCKDTLMSWMLRTLDRASYPS